MKKVTIKEKEDLTFKKDYDLSKGIRGRFYVPKKVSTTIRIDNDMIVLFKKLATETKIGYQTLINTALREYSTKIRKKADRAG